MMEYYLCRERSYIYANLGICENTTKRYFRKFSELVRERQRYRCCGIPELVFIRTMAATLKCCSHYQIHVMVGESTHPTLEFNLGT